MDAEKEQAEVFEEDEVLKRHRQERKELQAKIMSLKKTAPKGDKRKKKEIADMVLQLEKELDEKQTEELGGIQKLPQSVEPSEEPVGIDEPEETAEDMENSAKTSRAQRRRNKKISEEKERDKRITQQKVQNRTGPRVVELKQIKETLETMGLELHHIPADGDCLYFAVNHQLAITGRETSTVTDLRKLTADFIRENKDEFIPFMYSESDDAVTEDQFEDYCRDVANTKFWGGQMELRALSAVLKCPIKVIQASGPTTTQGENFDGPPLILTYHRHLYKLGEHYNATIIIDRGDAKQDL